MCARYDLNSPAIRLVERFGLTIPPEVFRGGEVRPTDAAPIIAPDRKARMFRWGLTVDWDRKPLINARAESLEERATFRPLLPFRCLIPVDGWYEWRKEGATRIKTRIAPPEDGPFALAGLVDPDREVFTVITCAPAPSVAPVHSRMPVLLAGQEAEARWLDLGLAFSAAATVLVPYAGALEVVEESPPSPRQARLFRHPFPIRREDLP
ncbi:MAG: SOS response-associated peptidase [Rhodospirillum sp.]|nr:SOS response-associated peptidase [Rhodospirillum sp.]MCF8489907.1 SOS response-associated peptidase [Rhodospirillum sp.]MCF8501798.1 SOS response-associated peptidase [Rhodospirillum sp.]